MLYSSLLVFVSFVLDLVVSHHSPSDAITQNKYLLRRPLWTCPPAAVIDKDAGTTVHVIPATTLLNVFSLAYQEMLCPCSCLTAPQ